MNFTLNCGHDLSTIVRAQDLRKTLWDQTLRHQSLTLLGRLAVDVHLRGAAANDAVLPDHAAGGAHHRVGEVRHGGAVAGGLGGRDDLRVLQVDRAVLHAADGHADLLKRQGIKVA